MTVVPMLSGLLPDGDATCAVWEPGDDLPAAQDRGARRLLESLWLEPGGTLLVLAPTDEGVPAVARRAARHGAAVTVAADLGDASGGAPYDAVVSVRAVERISAGNPRKALAATFRRVRALTASGARFALLTATVSGSAETEPDAAALLDPETHRFRLAEVVMACGAHWEVEQADSLQSDYARTAREVLGSVRDRRRSLHDRFGPQRTERLEQAVTGWARALTDNRLTLTRLLLRRID
ncbi:hypothetical protein Drose_26290 [Dactylosporangium roseum]|uniref:Uncharacterized protein n=1 Tax=Dactylosporangium roseum TaxID=47989 RepID=A0ABY5YY87_9ACTN|nr:class I SAM-dependent methyltransferase [Dactylosporangium roseum]UWZ34704.1 hypothetical protein Drose_26290 [Dactylosporangium roseum]